MRLPHDRLVESRLYRCSAIFRIASSCFTGTRALEGNPARHIAPRQQSEFQQNGETDLVTRTQCAVLRMLISLPVF